MPRRRRQAEGASRHEDPREGARRRLTIVGRPFGQALARRDIANGTAPASSRGAPRIHRPFWRRSYATEAAAATRDYAFQTAGKKRIIAPIRPENVPSQGVALKLGMGLEKRAMYAELEHLIFSVSR